MANSPTRESTETCTKFQDVYFTIKQTADFLNVDTKTLESWRKKGSGPPAYKTFNGRVYYKIAELREFVLTGPAMIEKFVTQDRVKEPA